ncbi:hypothetical protein FVE85_4933 [Porphyridium purpureum]|uniref:Uncharacterized protein n=1 Tax=Porphyridium purpureum TaxID=35688 RepID=A0A5J4YR76_PORPP|nr:hypothetical protein FVE85_4933 [Porphyridium purpureum]|eukprot:POR1217..scf236_6
MMLKKSKNVRSRRYRLVVRQETPQFVLFARPCWTLQRLARRPDELLATVRELLKRVEKRRRKRDYHLCVTQQRAPGAPSGDEDEIQWLVIHHMDKPLPGPVPRSICMSCHPELPWTGECVVCVRTGQPTFAPISPGIGALCAWHTLIPSPFPLVRACVDAKARPVFVLLPTRHVERLAALRMRELLQLLLAAGHMARRFGFVSLRLNQGAFRNHAHLHLKLELNEEAFRSALTHMPGALHLYWNRAHFSQYVFFMQKELRCAPEWDSRPRLPVRLRVSGVPREASHAELDLVLRPYAWYTHTELLCGSEYKASSCAAYAFVYFSSRDAAAHFLVTAYRRIRLHDALLTFHWDHRSDR